MLELLMSKPHITTFFVKLVDKSVFNLPKVWEGIFVKYFGSDQTKYQIVADRLKFVVQKYVKYKAWPSKFDGIGLEETDSDSKYDNPDFYWKTWKNRDRNVWDKNPNRNPTHAEIAERVMYQSMRVGILNKLLQDYARRKGKPVPKVVTPEQFLKEAGRK